MFLYSLTAVYFVLFVFLYIKRSGRLINGLLFMILAVLIGLSLLKIGLTAESSVVIYLLMVAAASVILFMTAGVLFMIVAAFVGGTLLLKREGVKKSNLLSLTSGFGIVMWIAVNMVHFDDIRKETVFYFFVMMINTALCYIMFNFSNYILSSWIYRIYYPIKNIDYVIVLGAGLIDGREVSPLLAGRIERAAKVYYRQIEKGIKAPILLMSGGQGSDEKLSEAQAMKKYAMSKGIDKDDILIEEKSANTYENMLFSKNIIEERERNWKNKHILFATTNYHVFRAGLYAAKAGIKARGIGSRTKLYFKYNAMLREFAAILNMNRKFHIICCIAIMALIGIFFYGGAASNITDELAALM